MKKRSMVVPADQTIIVCSREGYFTFSSYQTFLAWIKGRAEVLSRFGHTWNDTVSVCDWIGRRTQHPIDYIAKDASGRVLNLADLRRDVKVFVPEANPERERNWYLERHGRDYPGFRNGAVPGLHGWRRRRGHKLPQIMGQFRRDAADRVDGFKPRAKREQQVRNTKLGW